MRSRPNTHIVMYTMTDPKTGETSDHFISKFYRNRTDIAAKKLESTKLALAGMAGVSNIRIESWRANDE